MIGMTPGPCAPRNHIKGLLTIDATSPFSATSHVVDQQDGPDERTPCEGCSRAQNGGYYERCHGNCSEAGLKRTGCAGKSRRSGLDCLIHLQVSKMRGKRAGEKSTDA